MESVIKDPRLKGKCQTFTPENFVSLMLDLAGYKDALLGKRILENCCGDGQFLVQIVKRYIEAALREGYSNREIAKGLETDIFAYEIDEVLVNKCKERLNAIVYKYDLEAINWHIGCKDYLSQEVCGAFDFIVGNPPYIAYQDLPAELRIELKNNFKVCKKGKFDYCYAFIEKSYNMLRPGGKLVYIIPSNIFKNVFAEELRELIKSDLVAIVDYPQDRVFADVLVSPAIISIEKNSKSTCFSYTKRISQNVTQSILTKDLLKAKWIFDRHDIKGKKVGDFFKVSNVIATLCNQVFILKEGRIEGEYFCFDENKVEASILKIATSPKSKRYSKGKIEYIIFPYRYNENGNLSHYTEEEMVERFPATVRYLEQHKLKLADRASDKGAEWFEYGRSQALQNINHKKIMISSVISEDTSAYLLSENEIPYAGLYIVPIGDLPLETLLTELNSANFKKYVSCVGVSVSGSSKRITASDIENYMF